VELWQALLVAFGGNAALLLVLGFLGRSIASHALNKDIEKFKGDLRLTAAKHEITFRRLDEKRADVVAELYKLLVRAYWEAESFTTPMEWAGEPGKQEKYVAAQNAIADYFRFFDQHRIYISEDLCRQLESFARELREPVNHFGVWLRHDHVTGQAAVQKNDAWDAAWKKVREDVPKLRASIEREFRTIIGSGAPAA
jgi:acetylornithine deacetylase/succinyl-diaminopimelate desuccinylase-like protein